MVGLAMLDAAARRELLADDFLAILANEARDGHPSVLARLTPDMRKQLDRLLGLSGSTSTYSDIPVKTEADDQLGRFAFAEVLASRICQLRDAETGSPLVIHLDGPWGSGKSTILNFLEVALAERESNSWIVLRYNAWQQQRLDLPLVGIDCIDRD